MTRAIPFAASADAPTLLSSAESASFAAERRIADLARFVVQLDCPAGDILEFGSGIGESIPSLRKHFPQARVTCTNFSARMVELARSRFPGSEPHLLLQERVPLPAATQDIIVSACAFHRIPPQDRLRWQRELRRLARPGGLLVIYEPNHACPIVGPFLDPFKPRIASPSPSPSELRRCAAQAGWRSPRIDYKVFFPRALSRLWALEPRLEWLPLATQYRLVAHQRS